MRVMVGSCPAQTASGILKSPVTPLYIDVSKGLVSPHAARAQLVGIGVDLGWAHALHPDVRREAVQMPRLRGAADRAVVRKRAVAACDDERPVRSEEHTSE